MTYKKIVANMVEQDARKWIEKLLDNAGYDEAFVFSDDVEMEHDKEMDTFLYTVKISVRFKNSIITHRLEVGGTVDDLSGICHSVVWDTTYTEKEIIWMSVQKTRNDLGIKAFKIA